MPLKIDSTHGVPKLQPKTITNVHVAMAFGVEPLDELSSVLFGKRVRSQEDTSANSRENSKND